MKWRTEVFILAALALTGCASGPPSDRSPLLGMVYNMDRAPVGDVSVRLLRDGKPMGMALTDIRGRFSLPDVSFGSITLEFTKETYETASWTFRFLGPSQVIYMKMENGDQLLDEAGDAIEKRDWASASGFLDRVDKLVPHSRETQYLRSIILTDQGKPAEAATILETLSSGAASYAVELALADLYQYKLGDDAKALTHLKRALTLKDDVDVEKRVAELQAAGS